MGIHIVNTPKLMYRLDFSDLKDTLGESDLERLREQFTVRSYLLAAVIDWRRLNLCVIELWMRENQYGDFFWRRGETIYTKKFGGMELIAAVTKCYKEVCNEDRFKEELLFYIRSMKPGQRISNRFLELLTGIQSPICKDWIREYIQLRK